MDTLKFNNSPSNIMHIDINSCFATIEQQANPFLRGKPIAVAAFCTPRGCILAASVEAKRFGIKTGMRVMDGKQIYPGLIVLPPDPNKYRDVHIKLHRLLTDYSFEVTPKSIDEFVLTLHRKVTPYCVAIEIKQRIKKEIGEWLTVSIGIAPNRYLAKIGAGLHKQSLKGDTPYKPDGLDEINKDNFLEIYSKLKLTDLTGIKNANAARLNSVGIYSVLDFYNYNKPILGSWWNLRLRGYEVDNFKSKRQSYGNEVSTNLQRFSEIAPIIARLTEKASSRARMAGLKAQKKHVEVSTHKISVHLYDLIPTSILQLDLFGENIKKEKLECVISKINQRWGEFTVCSARSLSGAKAVMDRIAFGQGLQP